MKFRRFLLVAAVAAPIFAATTVASAAPKSSTTPWIQLHQDAGLSATTSPSLGDMVTFDAGYPSNVRNPRVDLKCYQNGALVYGETASLDQDAQTQLTGQPGLTLGGGASLWLTNGGPADCVATLYYLSQKSGTQIYNGLATTEFAAAG